MTALPRNCETFDRENFQYIAHMDRDFLGLLTYLVIMYQPLGGDFLGYFPPPPK